MYKKSTLFLLFIFIGVTALAQTADSLIYSQYTYPNGTVSSEGHLLNGKPEGYWKSYHPNGKIASEGFRKNFELDSTWIFYNEKGEKNLEINYSDGKKNGKRIQFFKKEYIVEHWRLDTLVDFTATYFTDGKLKKMTPIVDSKPHGMEKEYNKDSLIITVTQFYKGQLVRRESINRIDQFDYKQGSWKYFWLNGNLKLEGNYSNDKKNGYFKYYDESGNFLKVEKWEKGELIEDAPETKTLEKKMNYHPNGQPSIIATYYKDIPEGIRREYDTLGNIIKGYVFKNGFLKYEGITDANGLRQGVWKEFYESGELKSKGTYKNSTMIGKWNFYFTNGDIEVTGKYNNKGQKLGEWVWYYPNGQELMVENWLKGKLDGEYYEYNEQGDTITTGSYYMDEEDGPWYYNNNGTIEKGTYYEGMRIENWKIWFPNGKVAFDMNYDQDLYDGKYTAYWDNGQIKISGKYESGTPIGTWVRYDEDGNPIMTTIYKNGREVQWNDYKIPYE